MQRYKEGHWAEKIVIAILIIALIEIIFFRFHQILFSVLFSGICIYYGYSRYSKLFGKMIFWMGIISGLIGLIHLFIVRLIFFILFLYFISQHLQKRREPIQIKPKESLEQQEKQNGEISKPVITNRIFGSQQTPEYVYEWNDLNVISVYGDTHINLSNTVLPKEISVISIRNGIGDIEIFVPYDVGVQISHTCLFGTVRLFEEKEKELRNQQIMYRSEGYNEASYKIKVVTSIGAGNLVVKWI
ncbi:cell wall-active antibiotics response protein LiaF [Bacillus sp. D386]|uniref:cell wall-active antibiotics response protein LiaF n=1 Tax=Bacillus sp. D386 TaxID=2587155 RepID=UPI00111F88F6|nr:cell wall-active antibiotics response protein LiaF [Bacillus sp. D386]